MENKNCSECGGQMVYGRAAIRKNIAAKLSWPFASDRLFFKPQGEKQKSVGVLYEGKSYQAYRCENCGALLVTGERWTG